MFRPRDFRPGDNFVLEMDRALEADAVIAVSSPDSLRSTFARSDWAASFATDPQGAQHRLIPVRVRECRPANLLGSIIYIVLIGVGVDL